MTMLIAVTVALAEQAELDDLTRMIFHFQAFGVVGQLVFGKLRY